MTSSQVQNRLAPLRPLESPRRILRTEQSVSLGRPRLCTHRVGLAGAGMLPEERAAALGQRPGSHQAPKLTRRWDTACVPGPPNARQQLSVKSASWERDWAQSSSRRGSGSPRASSAPAWLSASARRGPISFAAKCTGITPCTAQDRTAYCLAEVCFHADWRSGVKAPGREKRP